MCPIEEQERHVVLGQNGKPVRDGFGVCLSQCRVGIARRVDEAFLRDHRLPHFRRREPCRLFKNALRQLIGHRLVTIQWSEPIVQHPVKRPFGLRRGHDRHVGAFAREFRIEATGNGRRRRPNRAAAGARSAERRKRADSKGHLADGMRFARISQKRENVDIS